jgi:cytosine/adenosine deaminase-related metal-dependent hydrolase
MLRKLGFDVTGVDISGDMLRIARVTDPSGDYRLVPGDNLENRAPTFKDKGRIRVGADADITVFDPNRVMEKATYEEPLQYSEGIQFVLVNGVPIGKEGQLVEGVFPGRPARALIHQ